VSAPAQPSPLPAADHAALSEEALAAIARGAEWPTTHHRAGKGSGAMTWRGAVPAPVAVQVIHEHLAQRGSRSTGHAELDWYNAALGLGVVYGDREVPAERGVWVVVVPTTEWGGSVRLGREEEDAQRLRIEALRRVTAALDAATPET